MNIAKLLLLGVLSMTRAEDAPAERWPVFKARANIDTIKRGTHARDHVAFDAFQDVPVAPSVEGYSDVKMSLSPQSGSVEDFDFDLSMKLDDLGAESRNVQFNGSGVYNGSPFTFSGPIDHVKMSYYQTSKYNSIHKYDAIVFKERDMVLDIDPSKVKVDGADVNVEFLVSEIKKALTKHKSEIQDADQEHLKHFPMDIAMPYVFFFYAVQFSQDVSITPDGKFVQLDFAWDHFPFLSKLKKH